MATAARTVAPGSEGPVTTDVLCARYEHLGTTPTSLMSTERTDSARDRFAIWPRDRADDLNGDEVRLSRCLGRRRLGRPLAMAPAAQRRRGAGAD
jgi:hypothetical protein